MVQGENGEKKKGQKKKKKRSNVRINFTHLSRAVPSYTFLIASLQLPQAAPVPLDILLIHPTCPSCLVQIGRYNQRNGHLRCVDCLRVFILCLVRRVIR